MRSPLFDEGSDVFHRLLSRRYRTLVLCFPESSTSPHWRKYICHVAGNMAALYFCRWWARKPIRISVCDLDSRVAAQTRRHTAPGGNISVTAKCERGFNDGGKNISTKKQPEGGTGESQGIRSHLSGLPLPASPESHRH